MENWDIKKIHRNLYAPKSRQFEVVEVPNLLFVMIDGQGDPNTAPAYAMSVEALYTISYAARALCKAELGRVHTVGPLEGLWTADDLDDYLTGNRANWRWTMMISQPDWVSQEIFDAARAKAAAKVGASSELARLERYDEGLAVQFLHIGAYRDEAPMIARLHDSYIPDHGLIETGPHHEIYLSDPRKTPEERLKTIVRQPVARRGEG